VLRDPEGKGPNISLDKYPEYREAKEAGCISICMPKIEMPKWSGLCCSARSGTPGGTSRAMTLWSCKIRPIISFVWCKGSPLPRIESPDWRASHASNPPHLQVTSE
jgi:hypothetical protein